MVAFLVALAKSCPTSDSKSVHTLDRLRRATLSLTSLTERSEARGGFGTAYYPRARPSWRFYLASGPSDTGKRDHGHPHTTPPASLNTGAPGHRRADWARRKPMLLFLLSRFLLLRFADRRFSGSLFQEPPRITRWSPSVPLPYETV